MTIKRSIAEGEWGCKSTVRVNGVVNQLCNSYNETNLMDVYMFLGIHYADFS